MWKILCFCFVTWLRPVVISTFPSAIQLCQYCEIYYFFFFVKTFSEFQIFWSDAKEICQMGEGWEESIINDVEVAV